MRKKISVLVPHTKAREAFFLNYCLPSIYANAPFEVLIDKREAHPNVKRNALARRAKGDYLFFCDDDIILAAGALSMLGDALAGSSNATAFAYCDHVMFTMPGCGTMWNGARLMKQPDWDAGEISRTGSITPMSLIKRTAFPGFDETLPKGHWWDVCLTLIKAGWSAIRVGSPLFLQFDLDNGLSNSSTSNRSQVSSRKIRRKHLIFN